MLYRVLFHHFDRFLTAYESRCEKEYGHFQPVVKEVVERYLDCGNPRSGFARIRCPDCHGEHLLTFFRKGSGLSPFGRIPGRSARSAARPGLGRPNFATLTSEPDRNILRFVRESVDPELAAGDLTPSAKRKFL